MATKDRNDYTNTDITRDELCKMTAEELESFYRTDAAHGLSPRDAAERIKKRTEGRLFSVIKLPTSSCIAHTFSQPILWILLALALVAVLFEHPFVGAMIALIAVGEGILLGLIERKAQTVDAGMQALDAPKPRVLRGGRLYRISEGELAMGDVIVLFEGDILPADVRFLSADELEVEEYVTSERVVLVKNAAPIQTEIPASRLNSPDNMAYAGDVVRRGCGVAVVTAVGLSTRVGAKEGGIRPLHLPAHLSSDAATVRTVGSFFSVYSIISAISIIPLVIIGILTLGGRFDLFGIVLTAVALAASTVGVRCAVLLRVNHTVCRTGLSERGEAGTSSLVKSRISVDTIGRITDIVAIGSAAIHDGIPHPEEAMISGERYTFSEGDEGAPLTDLAEKLYLLTEHSQEFDTNLSFSEIRALTRLFCEWAEPEIDSLSLRLESIIPVDEGIHIAYKSGVEQTLRVTDNLTQMKSLLTDEEFNFANDSRKNGLGVMLVMSEVGAYGIITFARHTSKRTAGAVRSLEDKGVRVFAFDYSDSYETRRALTECGFNSNAPIYRASKAEECVLALNSEDKIFSSVNDFAESGVRAFTGVRQEEIEGFITALKKDGRRVMVIAHELDDMWLMDMGDVSVTCSPDCIAERSSSTSRRPLPVAGSPDSHPNGARACDLMLRRADMIISRASVSGGGMLSVERAYTSALRCGRKLSGAIKYLTTSIVIRALFVALPMIFGLSLMQGALVLASGMVIDALALLGIALGGDSSDENHRANSFREHNAIWMVTSNKLSIISAGVSFAAYFTVSLLAFLIGIGQLGKIFDASAFAMLMLQLTVYLTTVRWWGGDRGRRWLISRATAFLSIAILLAVLGTAVFLMISGVSPVFILLATVAPIAYVFGAKLVKRITK